MSETSPLPRVVLDTVVLVQALISGRGTSAGCIDRLKAGRFIVLFSDATLAEAKEVPLRSELTRRYSQLTPARVDALFADLERYSLHVAAPPRRFELPRDPKDEPLIDVALAGGAQYLVTWNRRHLTYLMDKDTPEGIGFCTKFPNLKIVAPPDLLSAIDRPRPDEEKV
jgi:putative PIN family toxin of toxin-antitoxin system